MLCFLQFRIFHYFKWKRCTNPHKLWNITNFTFHTTFNHRKKEQMSHLLFYVACPLMVRESWCVLIIISFGFYCLKITFCKPCFVPSYFKRQATPRTPVAIIYLQTAYCLSFPPFSSFRKMPLPLFGFLARGVYRVPLLQFLARLRHCGTFRILRPYLFRLRSFLRRQPSITAQLP